MESARTAETEPTDLQAGKAVIEAGMVAEEGVGSRGRVVALSTAWSGNNGGITVNRELCVALAEIGYDVTARVSEPSPAHPRVHVQGLTPIPGIDARGQLLRTDGLPRNVDVLIGHGRFSGGAASYLRDQFYPQARVVYVVHALTEELDRFRNDPLQANDRDSIERQLLGRADLALGVGPLLAEEAARLARMSPRPPKVAEIIPGVTLQPPPVYFPQQRRLNMLLFGRAGDPLKGADIAADAVRLLRGRGIDVQLTVRGVDPLTLREQEETLSTRAGCLTMVKPFTTDRGELDANIRSADLMVMPSRNEGFGLAATEAAGFGVPIMVGANSGAGTFLSDRTRVPQRLSKPSVVPMRGTEDNLGRIWADHAEPILRNIQATRRRALNLRAHLGKHYSWRHAAQTLHEHLQALRPPPLQPPHRLDPATEPPRPPPGRPSMGLSL